jgi:hypothetical protein
VVNQLADYKTKVTLELNTDPPPMDLPGDPMSTTVQGSMSLDELGAVLKSHSTEFTIPPELLE